MPALDGVEHRFLDLAGLRMHVAEAGHGDLVLCCMVFPSTGGSGARSSPV